jgi:hypothetical protein
MYFHNNINNNGRNNDEWVGGEGLRIGLHNFKVRRGETAEFHSYLLLTGVISL